VSATVTVSTSASPSPGAFTLTITGTSTGGATRSFDLTIVVAGSGGSGGGGGGTRSNTLPAPTSRCTKTGPFKDPRVEGLVTTSALATVTTSQNLLTLTRNSDHRVIVNGVNNVSAFGFSPNGKYFVLITIASSVPVPTFSLTLYSVPAGGL